MSHAVMVSAERREILERRCATYFDGDDVMEVEPAFFLAAFSVLGLQKKNTQKRVNKIVIKIKKLRLPMLQLALFILREIRGRQTQRAQMYLITK